MKFNNKKLKKNFWKKNFEKKMSKKFFFLILEKSFDKKNVGKINYRTKIFITKIYSNIVKCHIILALLAFFDKNRAKDRE